MISTVLVLEITVITRLNTVEEIEVAFCGYYTATLLVTGTPTVQAVPRRPAGRGVRDPGKGGQLVGRAKILIS